jgi:catechol 2,3-dioxygenase-like lactoylglutathione lyase family enzyme
MTNDNFSISDDRLRPTVARVSLWTADAERSESFYRDLFGFERVFARTIAAPSIVGSWNFPEDAEMDVVLLRSPRGETELGLSAIRGVPISTRLGVRDGEPPSVGTAYIVLYVPDLDEVLGHARARGAVFNRPPKRFEDDEGRVIYEAAIYDPDGTVLLVVQDIKAPK